MRAPGPRVSEPWTAAERRVLDRLTSPGAVQAFLDTCVYSDDPCYRSPRQVLADRRAHCFDGATLAAAALRRLGHRPLLVDLRAVNDDDHILTLFRGPAGFGAVAKSNFVGLRYREPIHRTLRELVLSYFEPYYNTLGEKTLRAYSAPLDLAAFDRLGWLVDAAAMDVIAARLDSIRHFPILSAAAAKALLPVDERSLAAGLVGVNEAGLYRPGTQR